MAHDLVVRRYDTVREQPLELLVDELLVLSAFSRHAILLRCSFRAYAVPSICLCLLFGKRESSAQYHFQSQSSATKQDDSRPFPLDDLRRTNWGREFGVNRSTDTRRPRPRWAHVDPDRDAAADPR